MGNSVNLIDPSGHMVLEPFCPVGRWDCVAVKGVSNLRSSFLGSASRHNSIPGMDDNGFAALIAATIVSERRIGNIPPDGNERDRYIQQKEDIVASIGCVVSGEYILQAYNNKDYELLLRYLFNYEIPDGDYLYTLASVGIGNIKLKTAGNLWKQQACGFFGDCVTVPIGPMQKTNNLNISTNILDPYKDGYPCGYGATCTSYLDPDISAYSEMAIQLSNDETNIEYVAANLQAGALRALSLGITPTAFNSVTWHQKGVQTDDEIYNIGKFGHSVGGAVYVLDDMATALQVLNVTSNWSLANEEQYWRYR